MWIVVPIFTFLSIISKSICRSLFSTKKNRRSVLLSLLQHKPNTVFYFHNFVVYFLPEFYFHHLKFRHYLYVVVDRNHFMFSFPLKEGFIYLYDINRTFHFWSFWKLINNQVTAQIVPVNYSGFLPVHKTALCSGIIYTQYQTSSNISVKVKLLWQLLLRSV